MLLGCTAAATALHTSSRCRRGGSDAAGACTLAATPARSPGRLCPAAPPRSDIKRLWKLAGQRYTAPKQQVAAAIGPDYSLWHVSAAGQEQRGRRSAAPPWLDLGAAAGAGVLGTGLLPQVAAHPCLPLLPTPTTPSPPAHPQDLPSVPGQLALFSGKAALASHALGISSFQKAFFLAPVRSRGVPGCCG